MTDRYQSFSFVLSLNGESLGGFTEVTGIGTDTRLVRRPRQVTLKRGVVDSRALLAWMRASGQDAVRQTAVLTAFDASRQSIQRWTVRGAVPVKHTGPALSARGGDVAMEELVLSADGIELAS